MSEGNPQDYKGNGKHKFEEVYLHMREDTKPTEFDAMQRLRVPGGWLYRNIVASNTNGTHVMTTFVPMPEVVKHKV